jgi:DNA (cytosine-5)-methyltransferase 1
MITIGTDFSGIGAPEQGLIKLGVEHKSMFACDVDKYAKQSYLANYDTEHFYDDITTRNHNEAPCVDLYVAGFPCQAFSMAGKRKGFEDTRGTLFFDLLQYLKAKKPKYFVLENVKGLLSHNGGRTFLTILDCLAKTVNGQYSFTMYDEGLGYHVYYKVLNTKDYGLPQNRERVFIVGFRDDNHTFRWPKPFKLELKLKDILQDNPDSKYNLSKNTILEKGVGNVLYNRKGFRTNTQVYDINKICGTIDTGTGGGRQPHVLVDDKYYLSDKAKKSIIENPKNLQKSKVNPDISTTLQSPGNACGVYKGATYISKEDGTTYCLDTGNNQAIEYDKRIRRLTPKECFRLQGFPDSFVDKCREIGISDTQLYKQAGNSMTADAMAYLIKEVLINEKSV